MKRSSTIVLALLGGASAGALGGCSPHAPVVRISPESVYVNDYHLPGAGYYHAPFHAFFPHPYNYFNPATHQYYYGGQWGPAPHQSAINISAPTPAAATFANNARSDIVRGGFGSYSGGGYYGS